MRSAYKDRAGKAFVKARCSITIQDWRLTMNLRGLLQKEIYIRLDDDQNTFLCTVRYGRLFSKRTEVSLVEAPIEHLVAPDQTQRVPLRKQSENG
jgi:hypothetical protein